MAKRFYNSAMIYAVMICALLLQSGFHVEGARTSSGSNRKSSSGSRYTTSRQSSSNSNTHVTQPSYNANQQHSSNSDLTKLSYPSHNAQPNKPAPGAIGGSVSGGQNAPNYGWAVPKNQGPPPAYSASNPSGGAHTNMNESPPKYTPNNAMPPSYGSATGSNVHQPISATNVHGVQSGYPQQQHLPAGASYYPAGQVPAGASYYPSGHMPAGASYSPNGHVPAGGSYYPAGGHMPAGATYYPAGGAALPQGASYYPAGGALPAGATYYSSPPQQTSSGLGFGSGLAAGAIGGAILGHVLTPSNTRVIEHAPAAGGSSGDDKIIIINNGEPAQTQKLADGTTIITTGGQAAPGQAAPVQPAAAPAPQPGQEAAAVAAVPPPNTNNNAVGPAAAVPLAPMGAVPSSNENMTNVEQAPPAPGGIICVPVRVNETDPNDSTKMIEIEKIACYPAPPPPQPPAPELNGNNAMPASNAPDGSVPLAPMNPPVIGPSSQQIQAATNQDVPMEKSSGNNLLNKQIALTINSMALVSILFGLLLRVTFH